MLDRPCHGHWDEEHLVKSELTWVLVTRSTDLTRRVSVPWEGCLYVEAEMGVGRGQDQRCGSRKAPGPFEEGRPLILAV